MKSVPHQLVSLVCRIALLGTVSVQASPGHEPSQVAVEVSFESEQFHLAGSLYLPDSVGRYPCVMMVHGDGQVDRTNFGSYEPIIDRFLKAGYACLTWDKPGTGSSTGSFTPGRLFRERARIILDGLDFITHQPGIDTNMIGMWGISQAGYVMPLVLEETDRVAFMIAVSCPAMNSVDQSAYLVTRQLICNGYSRTEASRIGQAFAGRALAREYDVYLEYARLLDTIAYIARIGWGGVLPEEGFTPPDTLGEMFLNPATFIPGMTIPILAILGEKDTQIDPFQSAVAFQMGLERARNPNFSVRIFREANHGIYHSDSGCMGEMRGPMPGRPVGYVEEYLDTIENWLKKLILKDS